MLLRGWGLRARSAATIQRTVQRSSASIHTSLGHDCPREVRRSTTSAGYWPVLPTLGRLVGTEGWNAATLQFGGGANIWLRESIGARVGFDYRRTTNPVGLGISEAYNEFLIGVGLLVGIGQR
jgi:hypothetical protein